MKAENSVMMGPRHVLLVLPLVMCVAAVLRCPSDEILHHHGNGKAVCCKPAFNCAPGTEYTFCDQSGGYDRCTPCDQSMINFKYTSFHNSNYSCFTSTYEHEKCTLESTIPVPIPVIVDCALSCECNVADCFYGSPCDNCIGPVVEPCGKDEELNVNTGECVPCPPLMYSPDKSCGPCLWNETAWRIANDAQTTGVPLSSLPQTHLNNNTGPDFSYITITDEPLATTQRQEEEEDGEKTGGLSTALVVVILVVLVTFGIIIAILLYTCQKIRANDTNSRLVIFYYKLCPPEPNRAQSIVEDATENGRPTQHVAPTIRSSEVIDVDETYPSTSPLLSQENGVIADATESIDLSRNLSNGVMQEQDQQTVQKTVA